VDAETRAKVQASKDYYYILGVRPDATSEEIGEAYQEQYEKFGPHVSAQSIDPDIQIKTFKDISDAYEILMDPGKRKEYDRSSAQSRQSTSELRALWATRANTPPPSSSATAAGAHAAPEPPKVQALALEMELEVTLKEAVKGAKKQIKISDPRPCATCQGQKTTSRMQCSNCRGLGYFNVERVEEIELPTALYDGMEIRLPDQGRFDLRAGRQGDLIIKVKVRPHPVLSVLGRDITCNVPVTIYEAVLGAEIEVPCATGRVVMKIQPLTQTGRVYRLKGLGLAGADQLVSIDVVMPQSLHGDQVNLFKKLKELSAASGEPNPRESMFRQ
jgi:DnaJ-class molecular chaperone